MLNISNPFWKKNYTLVNVGEHLRPGKHMRLRGCWCNWGHLDEAVRTMTHGFIATGTPFSLLSEYDTFVLHGLLRSCDKHGRVNDLRLVDLISADHLHPKTEGKWPTHKVLGSPAGRDAIQTYLPELLTDDPTDIGTNEHGRFVGWNLPIPTKHVAALQHLTVEAIGLTEEWVSRRVAEGEKPKVILHFVGVEDDAALASFLRRMEAINVSVIACERHHILKSPPPAFECDELFDIDLSGACWTKGDSSEGSERSEEDRLRWNENAFLVVKGPNDLLKIARKSSGSIRFPYAGADDKEPLNPASGMAIMSTMTRVKGNFEALTARLAP